MRLRLLAVHTLPMEGDVSHCFVGRSWPAPVVVEVTARLVIRAQLRMWNHLKLEVQRAHQPHMYDSIFMTFSLL